MHEPGNEAGTEPRTGQEGYLLAVCLVILLVVVILVTGTLSLSAGYHRHTAARREKTQAFFAARDLAQALAGEMAGGESGFLELALGSLETGERLAIEGLPEGLEGWVDAFYETESGYLGLTVTAVCGSQQDRVTALFFYEPEEEETGAEETGEEETGQESTGQETIQPADEGDEADALAPSGTGSWNLIGFRREEPGDENGEKPNGKTGIKPEKERREPGSQKEQKGKEAFLPS